MLLQSKVMTIVLEMSALRNKQLQAENKRLEDRIRQDEVEIEGCRAAIADGDRIIDSLEHDHGQLEAEIEYLDTHRLHFAARELLAEDYDYHGVNELFRNDQRELLSWRNGKVPFIIPDQWDQARELILTLQLDEFAFV